MSFNLQDLRGRVDRRTIFDCVTSMFEHYAPLPCLGARRLDAFGVPSTSFSFLTYSQVKEQCLALGKGLMRSRQAGGIGLRAGELIGIRLQNCVEWLAQYISFSCVCHVAPFVLLRFGRTPDVPT